METKQSIQSTVPESSMNKRNTPKKFDRPAAEDDLVYQGINSDDQCISREIQNMTTDTKSSVKRHAS